VLVGNVVQPLLLLPQLLLVTLDCCEVKLSSSLVEASARKPFLVFKASPLLKLKLTDRRHTCIPNQRTHRSYGSYNSGKEKTQTIVDGMAYHRNVPAIPRVSCGFSGSLPFFRRIQRHKLTYLSTAIFNKIMH
jgi:hypothetical protein